MQLYTFSYSSVERSIVVQSTLLRVVASVTYGTVLVY